MAKVITLDEVELRVVLDLRISEELMGRGHNLLAQIMSEGQKVYVFVNDDFLDDDLRAYPSTAYYAC